MRPLLTLKELLLSLTSKASVIAPRANLWPPHPLLPSVVSVCWLTGKPGADKKSDNQKRPLLSAQQKKIDGRVESFSDRREEVCLSLQCIQQEIWFFKDFFPLSLSAKLGIDFSRGKNVLMTLNFLLCIYVMNGDSKILKFPRKVCFITHWFQAQVQVQKILEEKKLSSKVQGVFCGNWR